MEDVLKSAILDAVTKILMAAGVRFYPALLVVGALAETFFAYHRNAEHLTDKVHHLFRQAEPIEVTVEQLSERVNGEISHRKEKHRWAEERLNGARQDSDGAGKAFRLAEEVDHIQRRAADRGGRLVTVGPLLLFSTEAGDAWMLDPADHVAARRARDGYPEKLYLEEIEASFAIGWTGHYQIEDDALVYIDSDAAIGKFQISLAGFNSSLCDAASRRGRIACFTVCP